jgi:hypothetical protein
MTCNISSLKIALGTTSLVKVNNEYFYIPYIFTSLIDIFLFDQVFQARAPNISLDLQRLGLGCCLTSLLEWYSCSFVREDTDKKKLVMKSTSFRGSWEAANRLITLLLCSEMINTADTKQLITLLFNFRRPSHLLPQ